jgi:hypothetical protein
MADTRVSIDGYFQNPAYLEPNKNKILSTIIKIAQRKNGIKPCECQMIHVSVHIRRGDYLLEINAQQFGVLSDEYFNLRFSELTSHHIKVLSDSKLYEDKFKIPASSKIEFARTDSSAWETLSEMIASDILIISNSSLSWWGAKAGTFANPEMIVISPDLWFKGHTASNQLICDDWITKKTLWT